MNGLFEFPGEEFRFHGVQLAGPSLCLKKSGNNGAHKNNLARDMLRKVGKTVPRLRYVVFLFGLNDLNW